MTEPTDAEIVALIEKHLGLKPRRDDTVIDPRTGRFHDVQRYRDFARAVLAKWGTPPAVEGEPECTCSAKDAPFGTCCKVRSAFERWYDEQNYGRLQPFDVFKGGWIERHRLSSTPQPTQAQTVAVPLTCEWAHNEDDGFWETACGQSWRFDDGGPKENHMNFCHCCGKPLRIKGGQHG